MKLLSIKCKKNARTNFSHFLYNLLFIRLYFSYYFTISHCLFLLHFAKLITLSHSLQYQDKFYPKSSSAGEYLR